MRAAKLTGIVRDSSGISAVEFAIIVPVLFLLIFGVLDFGRALWEWNRAEKATQLGARYAVVSDLVATGLDFDGIPLAGGAGLRVPVGAVNGGDPIVCTGSSPTAVSCSPGSWGPADAGAFDRIVDWMRQVDDRITHSNVVVEYRHVGLGFAGNPTGPDIAPLITVKLTGMVFRPVTPGLAGIASITMPDFAASLTGEDVDG